MICLHIPSTITYKANLAETKEEPIEETVLVTTGCTAECEQGLNDKVKKALMIEDAALGCWISCDEDSGSDNEDSSNDNEDPNNYLETQLDENIFDPNEYIHNEDDLEVENEG